MDLLSLVSGNFQEFAIIFILLNVIMASVRWTPNQQDSYKGLVRCSNNKQQNLVLALSYINKKKMIPSE